MLLMFGFQMILTEKYKSIWIPGIYILRIRNVLTIY